LVTQAIAVGVTLVFCFVGTFVILKVLDATVGLRVYDEDEVVGLDLSQHGETAYTF
jgi:Amt family ammonium transporter